MGPIQFVLILGIVFVLAKFLERSWKRDKERLD